MTEKRKRVVIVDDRYVGIVDADFVPFADDAAPVVTLEDALQIVGTSIPQPTSHGIGAIRLTTVHPLPFVGGPKKIVVRYSCVRFADSDLDDNERKALEANLKGCLEECDKARRVRETGLVTP